MGKYDDLAGQLATPGVEPVEHGVPTIRVPAVPNIFHLF